MSTMFETPAQYERDLRSASKEWKRSKDASTKWLYGARPLHGCLVDMVTEEYIGGSESQRQKSRPRGKHSDGHRASRPKNENVSKLNRSQGKWAMPAGRMRSKMTAHEEMDTNGSALTKSISDLLPSMAAANGGRRKLSASDIALYPGVLYSFDSRETPGRPLSLDIFVKPTAAGRETERLVEKEYEIVNADGEVLRGRKARRTLRKAATVAGDGDDGREMFAEENDGFELV